MLFNSPEFLFGFLPVVLLGFFALVRWRPAAALVWLTLASLFFYAWWEPRWLPLLLASMAFNLVTGQALALRAAVEAQAAAGAPGGPGAPGAPALSANALLALGVSVNLALLVHYKYTGFIAQNVAALFSGAASAAGAAALPELPLGISFYTFTQIAFLVDARRGEASDFHPVRYGLFVTYYPHLIAGPILHHREMMPQFAAANRLQFDAARLADGLSIFLLGLFKKVVLADTFARWASPGFAAVPAQQPGFFEAWGTALSYTLQLYFDFSGYSDMAIGLALMIGVRLPQNFHSPYKALDIADFWRRWHMTLSRFLRDYLYIPLGGNRKGPLRRRFNLMATMLLGGLWHGAGWTFVLWGGLHGLYLVVHQAWSASLGPRWQRLIAPSAAARWLWRQVAWALTFLAVVVAWVFFRAADLDAALALLCGMAGLHGATLPDQILAAAPPLRWLAEPAGKVPLLADGTVMGAVEMAFMLAAGLAIVRFAPALQELSLRARLWLVVPTAALSLQAVLYGRASEFLYFQF